PRKSLWKKDMCLMALFIERVRTPIGLRLAFTRTIANGCSKAVRSALAMGEVAQRWSGGFFLAHRKTPSRTAAIVLIYTHSQSWAGRHLCAPGVLPLAA